ncbi:FAD-binding domain-containing protein [Staphylotrichum tortipilum]|uniref:FAD-binding domain-containing protein n=1 Tax=Staphylotrichum tortipilum TaxID=2831512 RepID=A0AAN6MM69_9PEZI|nr:FAD-binding domain-containing protein [Staphylotrichum longicolle]
MAPSATFLALISTLVILTSPAHALPNAVAHRDAQDSCHCFPGDACWPAPDLWNAFNGSLGGRLIANTPIAAVCHHSTLFPYDAAACSVLQNTWFLPQTHFDSSSSMMASLPTNNSCNPFLDASAPCTMGNYPVYSVNATGPGDYQTTLQFAQAHNIRLVIRNTAADYNGKSSGAGSLALWTHHLKSKEILEYRSNGYSGTAFRFGAGVQVTEAYEFSLAHGHLVVGANVPEVGLVGGYSQGGGHGPLVSRFGLAVDQVLEWEVVLASGEVVVASPDSAEHADLHWALCGGGGGTYAAVLSATVKAHPSLILSTANLTFALPPTAQSPDAFWEGVRVFVEHIPAINDAGTQAIWYVEATAFNLATLFAPGFDKTALDALMQPFLDALDRLELPYSYASEQHPGFLEGFLQQPGTGAANLNIGGRLIPRTLAQSNGGSAALTAAIHSITSSSGVVFSGVTFNVSNHAPEHGVGINPYWRETIFSAVFGTFFDWTDWEKNQRSADTITNDLLPHLERLTPGGAAYLNECDFQQADWKTVFYGANWVRLSEIKSKYDPNGVFYALGAVGSEGWTQQVDGRLCRAT